MKPSSQKRRLHPVAALLSVLRSLRSLIPLLVLAAIGGSVQDPSAALLWTLGLMVPLSLISGIGSWLRFRYWLENGELRIERGLLMRRRIFIPKDRIVAVDSTEGFLQRPFGLVTLLVKTAGSGTQAELSAIGRAEAKWLQEALSAEPPSPPLQSQDLPSDIPPTPRGGALSARHLLLAASTSGRLGVILSGLGWLSVQLPEELRREFLRATVGYVTHGPVVPVVWAAGALALAWFVSLVSELLRFGGFTVERRGTSLVVTRGIFEKRSVTIAVDRVQAVRFRETLLRQPLGYATVYVESAGHAEEKGQSTILHPLLHRRDWSAFLEALVPHFSLDVDWRKPPPRALPRFLLRAAPMGIVVAALVYRFSPWGGWSLLLVLPWLGMGYLGYRDSGAGVRGTFAAVRARGLHRVSVAFRRPCIQAAEARSTWFQRRRSLADLRLVVRSGSRALSATAASLRAEDGTAVMDWLRTPPKAPRESLTVVAASDHGTLQGGSGGLSAGPDGGRVAQVETGKAALKRVDVGVETKCSGEHGALFPAAPGSGMVRPPPTAVRRGSLLVRPRAGNLL